MYPRISTALEVVSDDATGANVAVNTSISCEMGVLAAWIASPWYLNNYEL